MMDVLVIELVFVIEDRKWRGLVWFGLVYKGLREEVCFSVNYIERGGVE